MISQNNFRFMFEHTSYYIWSPKCKSKEGSKALAQEQEPSDPLWINKITYNITNSFKVMVEHVSYYISSPKCKVKRAHKTLPKSNKPQTLFAMKFSHLWYYKIISQPHLSTHHIDQAQNAKWMRPESSYPRARTLGPFVKQRSHLRYHEQFQSYVWGHIIFHIKS